MSEQNLDKLMSMRNEALRLGVGSKPWIKFATTMIDSLPGLYDTGKKVNEVFAEQSRLIAELRDAALVIKAESQQLCSSDGGMETAIDSISKERQRQINEEGWDFEHDDLHIDGSLAIAAACYAAPLQIYTMSKNTRGASYSDPWPWVTGFRGEQVLAQTEWVKEGKPRRRQLVIAAALIVAEIERLDRSAQQEGSI